MRCSSNEDLIRSEDHIFAGFQTLKIWVEVVSLGNDTCTLSDFTQIAVNTFTENT